MTIKKSFEEWGRSPGDGGLFGERETERKMNIIMLGAQGTGKGTVAGLISGEIGIPQISTGDIFRKNISEKTPLGIEADKYISKRNLVPDEITVPMVEDRLT